MTTTYEPVIGLEVHAQLAPATKMFCAGPNPFGEAPNTVTCPVCLGLPGALPVANRQAFVLAIRAGLALDAGISRATKFDRKNYFYPDLPKGYQISQYDRPITHDGRLPLPSGRVIGITRAHLEEDAGKNTHGEGDDVHSLVDLNRCGIPLLEIVSEPDIRSPEEAVSYLMELKRLLRHLRVSDCDMEKGSLRVDVNVSIRRLGEEGFGTRTETKNLNSFKAVERALQHEIVRHEQVLEAGGRIEQETRLWNEDRGETVLMRKKEESQDYRYFPDPDLPPHVIDDAWIAEIRASLPELPWIRERRYQEELGLSAYDAGVLCSDREVCEYFEETASLVGDPKAAVNWITVDLFGLMNDRGHGILETGIPPGRLAALIRLVRAGTVNVPSGRKVLGAMYGTQDDPAGLIEKLGLGQLSDRDAIVALVRKAMEGNPKAVDDLRAGKQKAAGAIVGLVMRETRGRANPALVNEIIAELL